MSSVSSPKLFLLLPLLLLLMLVASGASDASYDSIPEGAIRVTAGDLDAARMTRRLEAIFNATATGAAGATGATGATGHSLDDWDGDDRDDRDDGDDSPAIPLSLQRLSRLLRRAEARKDQLASSPPARLLSFNRRKFFRGCKSFLYYYDSISNCH